MKIIKSFTLLSILICNLSVAQEIKTYNEEKIRSIPVGKADNQLGYMPHLLGAGGNPGPTTFSISDDGLIYICDVFNSRIIVYTLSLDYVRKIEIKDNFILVSNKIKIDKYNNIIGIYAPDSIIKIDGKGKEIYTFKEIKLTENVRGKGDFFTIDNYVLINDKKEGSKVIDEKGKAMDKNIKKKFMANMQVQSNVMSGLKQDVVNDINKFKEIKKIEIQGNRLLNSDPENHKYYYSIIKKNKNQNQTFIEPDGAFTGSLQAYDNEDNAYFIGYTTIGYKRILIVYSKYGDLLDSFYIPSMDFAISPDGDIYFMGTAREKDAIPFYKIKRRW